jgi:hypothetical protein
MKGARWWEALQERALEVVIQATGSQADNLK